VLWFDYSIITNFLQGVVDGAVADDE
jgi:hypothetical protein